MKKHTEWRKAWNLGREEAVSLLTCIGLALIVIIECIIVIILKTI